MWSSVLPYKKKPYFILVLFVLPQNVNRQVVGRELVFAPFAVNVACAAQITLPSLLVFVPRKVLVFNCAKRHDTVVGRQHCVLFGWARRSIQRAVIGSKVLECFSLCNAPVRHAFELRGKLCGQTGRHVSCTSLCPIFSWRRSAYLRLLRSRTFWWVCLHLPCFDFKLCCCRTEKLRLLSCSAFLCFHLHLSCFYSTRRCWHG